MLTGWVASHRSASAPLGRSAAVALTSEIQMKLLLPWLLVVIVLNCLCSLSSCTGSRTVLTGWVASHRSASAPLGRSAAVALTSEIQMKLLLPWLLVVIVLNCLCSLSSCTGSRTVLTGWVASHRSVSAPLGRSAAVTLTSEIQMKLLLPWLLVVIVFNCLCSLSSCTGSRTV